MQNHELIQKTIRLVTEERRIGVEVLECLQEIERRKAYSELGYDGLYSFCVKELKYSEAQAYRRIQAMRAVHELPELKEKIQSGVLSVTTVSQVQGHLRKQDQSGEKFTVRDKLELFHSMENRSAKEVEKTLHGLSGQDIEVVLTIKLSSEMKSKWDRIKNLSAHQTGAQDDAILELLMDHWLERNDPEMKLLKSKKPRAAAAAKGIQSASGNEDFLKKEGVSLKSVNLSRYIPKLIKQAVWRRDHGRCVNCSSTFALQFDHIKPFSEGGQHIPENLRLLCRNCNLSTGIKIFGLNKMKREPGLKLKKINIHARQ